MAAMTTEEWIDDEGNRFSRAGPDARIACFVPSLTELLIDLGLADQVVARTQFCIHPAAVVKNIPAIGGTKKVSVPKLKELAPTHAVLNIDENTVAMAEALRTFVPNVVVTHPLAPFDNLKLYTLMGGLFGREAAAEDLCRRFKAAWDALPGDAAGDPLNVLYFIWKDPWMTVSRDTYISAMLKTVGWQTTHHDPANRYPTVEITPEVVANTDLFLFSSEPYEFTASSIRDFTETYGCPVEKARLIDGEYCSWYGSRAIAGLRYLHDLSTEIRQQREG